ncbi:hypothetical protein [Anaeromyxobacter paludicola]|uniref:Glycosyltransferase RgtA/B/C/D-like domain-containing protein n=1 Tax=Anaeromyxobacter paludicola TaxID=2918171 RepID=A0ABM7XG05_9BACT|nr:hypothetical protein [Anaeromyxobacter paludicola]BDG10821.1 hypothetical protein AMPC_39340 [Anaeromyxobacter paludicola]
MDATSSPLPPVPHASPARARLALAGGLLALLAAAAALQAWTPIPWDADTAYHVAVARLIRAQGLLHAFPWTPFSWLARHYADKELLFHLLLVPLSGLDWVTDAKVVGALCGFAALSSLYLVLRAERVRLGAVWALAALASSGYFAMRLGLVRPHLLSMALAPAVTWAAARRRHGLLFAACVAYPLAYTAWHTALGLVALAELARVAAGQRPRWGAPLAAAGGLAVGLLVHPNFPAILSFFWIQNFQILMGTAWTGMAGVELGTEYLPFTPAEALRFALLPGLAALAGAALAWRERREGWVPLAFALPALAFGALTFRTQRFVEYFVPFSFAALALALRGRGGRALPAAALGIALAFTGLVGRGPLELMRLRLRDFSPEVEAHLRARIPEGAQVFACDWLTTGELMLALPERRFLVALDPVLFLKNDPERYRLWWQLDHQPPPHPALAIREGFGADFVVCDTGHPAFWPLFDALQADPGARLLHRSPLWIGWDLRPGPAPAPNGP